MLRSFSSIVLSVTILVSLSISHAAGAHTSNASDNCSPTLSESNFINGINSLYQQAALWGDFPQSTQFIVFDFANNSPGYLVTNSENTLAHLDGSILSRCTNTNAWEFRKPLEKKDIGSYYPHCGGGASPEACSAYPGAQTVFETTKKPTATYLLDHDRLKLINKQLFGDGKHYSIDQIGIYHNAHEMFHEYQVSNGFYDAKPSLSFLWQACMNERPDWVERYEQERKWWSQNLQAIYNPNTSKDELKAIATEFIHEVRPQDPNFSECDEGLKSHERIEGTAHYIGHKALLRTGFATPQFLATIDSQFLIVPFESHSMMWVYATGGAITKLIDRLAIRNWKQDIQKSEYPYDVLMRGLESL